MCFFFLRILEVYLTVERLPSALRHVVGVTGKKFAEATKDVGRNGKPHLEC